MLRRLFRTFFTLEQWCIGWAAGDIDALLRDPQAIDWRWIRPRGTRALLADPFGIELDGRLQIVAERMVHGPSQGELVLIDPTTPTAMPRLALRTDFHLSYPFVVRDGDSLYVVPEQGASRSIRFYRLHLEHGVPRIDAQPAAIIEGLDAIDPTFLFHDQRWWLFCTRNFAADTDTPLLLFHAESLFGPYHAHPANPIVDDRARARPAGRIIRTGARLLRPAQDSSATYGGAIVLNEIDVLSTTHYAERPVGRIEPGQLRGAWRDGTHQLDHTDSFIVIDSKRIAFDPFAWLIRLRLRRRARVRANERDGHASNVTSDTPPASATTTHQFGIDRPNSG